MVSVWMDKKPVSMLSTLVQADITHTAQRKQKDGSQVPMQCTGTVVLYNKFMPGVDKDNSTTVSNTSAPSITSISFGFYLTYVSPMFISHVYNASVTSMPEGF